jgi:hypothetical protein
MAYIINRTDGTEFIQLDDATLDSTTNLKFVGRNYVGYGEVQNENFLFLLENFANESAPNRPVSGQLYYNTQDRNIYSYDGEFWQTVGSAARSETAPENAPIGSFWFDSTYNTVHVFTGNEWILVGPDDPKDSQFVGVTTRAVSMVLTATNTLRFPVVVMYANDEAVAVISNAGFTINQNETPLANFDDISHGITVSNASEFRGRLVGTADKATILATTRQINGVGFNGSQDITIKSSTTNSLVAGDYIAGSNFDGSTPNTWSVDATPNNVIGKVVARDSSGGFRAGNITADLTGNVTGNVTASSGNSTFDQITANTIIGPILRGNADTATRLRTARLINGTTFDGTSDVNITAPANTLTSDTLANNVVNSSLELVGTLRYLDVSGSGQITVASNLTIEATANNGTITVDKSFVLKSQEAGDSTELKLLSPAESTRTGHGGNGSLIPSNDNLIEIGSSSNRFANIHASTFTGNLTGNADTATLATTATNIEGGVAGGVPYQNATGDTDFVATGTPGYVLKSAGTGAPYWGVISFESLEVGDYLTGGNYDGTNPTSISVDASTTNTASKVVARDASGNFSAGTITASLNGVASQASTVYVDETIDDNRDYNVVFLDSTAGGNGYRTLQVDNTAFTFNPNTNTISGVNLRLDGVALDNVAKAGDTMSGFLTLHANPTSNLHAATKQYVDTVASTDYSFTYGVGKPASYTNQVGSFNNSRNYYDVFPPSGKTMSDLVAFIPSIKRIYYAGGVDGNDRLRNEYEIRSDRIRVWVQNTEQNGKPQGNYFAVWRN